MYNDINQHLDIGGRRLHLRCMGEGQPTIVLEAGMGDTLTTWAAIQPTLALETRVCSYDRAGLGASDPAPYPRLAGEMVADLQMLLSAASITSPYLLVGHSFGGQLIRLFAARHPTDVAGLVLIDPSHEDKYVRFEQVLTKELITRQNIYLADPARNAEGIDLLRSRDEMHAAHRILPVPLLILTRSRPDPPSSVWPSAQIQMIEEKLQEETLAISSWPAARWMVVMESSHLIHQDQPALVVAAIREVIAAIRTFDTTTDTP